MSDVDQENIHHVDIAKFLSTNKTNEQRIVEALEELVKIGRVWLTVHTMEQVTKEPEGKPVGKSNKVRRL